MKGNYVQGPLMHQLAPGFFLLCPQMLRLPPVSHKLLEVPALRLISNPTLVPEINKKAGSAFNTSPFILPLYGLPISLVSFSGKTRSKHSCYSTIKSRGRAASSIEGTAIAEATSALRGLR
jgi:hypothetical protein